MFLDFTIGNISPAPPLPNPIIDGLSWNKKSCIKYKEGDDEEKLSHNYGVIIIYPPAFV